MRQLLEYSNYRGYLKDAFVELGKSRKGIRSRFAEALDCRPGFISQVLDESMNLSADQASLASEFFGHTDQEAAYFLLLVLRERAGTMQLKNHLDRELETHRKKHLDLKERLRVDQKIRTEDQILFYSSWHYLAILSVISIPGYQTKESIAERLGLSMKQVSSALEMLLKAKIVKLDSGKYVAGEVRTHLEKDSPLISRHHLNWRLQAMQSIERAEADDLHYSSVVSLSEADMNQVKALIVSMIEKAAQVIAPSPEEKLCSLSVDFFEL